MPREVPEVFEWHGFTVHNGGLSDAEMKDTLAAYGSTIHRMESKGFGRLLYGPLFVVGDNLETDTFDVRIGQYKHINVSALYYQTKDLLVLNTAYAANSYIFAHELGHRQWFQFLTNGQRERWRENFTESRMVSVDSYHISMLNELFNKSAPSEALHKDDVDEQLVDEFDRRGPNMYQPYIRWDKFNYSKFIRSVKNMQAKYHLWDVLTTIAETSSEGGMKAYVIEILTPLSIAAQELADYRKTLSEFPNADDWEFIDNNGGEERAKERRMQIRANRWENMKSAIWYSNKIEAPSWVLGKEIVPSVSTSEYGKTNDEEDYAEAFAAYMTDSPMPEEVYDLFMSVHGLRKASMKSAAHELMKLAKELIALPTQLRMQTDMDRAKADRKRQERERDRYVREVSSRLIHLVGQESAVRKVVEKLTEEIPGRNSGDILTQRKNRLVKELKQMPEVMEFAEYIGGPERMNSSALYLIRDVALGQILLREAKEKAEGMATKWFVEKMLEERGTEFEEGGYAPDFRDYLPPNVTFKLGPTREVTEIVETFGREKKNWQTMAKKLAFIAQRFNEIVASVKKDMQSSDEVTRMCALMTAITIETGLRPGEVGNAANVKDPETGEEYEIDTFGVTTMQPSHVHFVRDNFAELNFVGKKAGQQVAALSDADILKALKQAVDSTKLNGETSMIFVTKAGEHVDYAKLKKYVANKWGDLTPTDFRKLKATREFYENLKKRVAAMRMEIRAVLGQEKEKIREAVVAAVMKMLDEAAKEAQAKLSHKDWETTIRTYVDPRVVVNFLSRGGLDDSLEDIIINGKNVRLVFDFDSFVEQAAKETMSKEASAVVTIEDTGATNESLADVLGDMSNLAGNLDGSGAIASEVLKIARELFSKNDIPAANRGGDCFEAAGNYIIDHAIVGPDKHLMLVHGLVTGQEAIAGVEFSHAWVEDRNMVIDTSNGRDIRMPKELYYTIGKIKKTFRYPARLAQKKLLQTGHYGPWELKSDY